MGCGNFFDTLFDSGQCLLLLAAATFYRAILFIIFLSASVGPATLACYLYVYFTGRDPYPEVQPAICMMLISCWAEFSVGIEKRLCGDFLERCKNGFPSVMSFGRFAVHFAMYLFAFCELYIEFEKAHTIPEPHREHHRTFTRRKDLYEDNIQSQEDRESMANKDEGWHVTIYLYSLSYLVFITSRNFHKDMILVVRNLPSVTYSVLNNWLMRISFAILHLVVNLFYFLPCLAIAYTANSYKTSGQTTFFQLNFTAGMAGMIAALFELNRPWPQRRGQMPFLFHENNIFGKNLLAHALVIGILYFFYRPKCHPKVPESMFDSTNHDVICYCLVVAFTTLHIVKFGVHAVLSLAHEYDHRMNELNNVILMDVGEENGAGSRNATHPHQDGDAAGLSEGGMCDRCIANLINNNSPAPSNVNQNGENGCGHPQTEVGSARAEEGSAPNAENENKVKSGEFKDIGSSETETEICQKPQCNGDGVNIKSSYDAVNKISASETNDGQLDLSCKNSKVDLNSVNDNQIEIPQK